MPIYALGDHEPDIHPDAWVMPEAVLIGRVKIGARATIWSGAVLRADDNDIVIGEETSVQDNAVLHVTEELPTIVGRGCTIGHLAHLEGCTVEDEALIGTGSIVLHEAVIGANMWPTYQPILRKDFELFDRYVHERWDAKETGGKVSSSSFTCMYLSLIHI